ncbi:hypothetical protein 2 [Hubei sobemo-like virus 2]|uniref:hypothetical protein 2 n=1 Tax=Hubei sobemo-like virus 2 TaxID=1923205 RepID=UPI00090A0874|nr:hypothetical protein 2 [Hubei sobemo-like virus 2]APG75903.1 hypothetical protein 2 [Hubei sobemo-like virus 2]
MIVRAMDMVPKDSSPGYPYALLAADNQQLFRDHSAMVIQLVKERLAVLDGGPLAEGPNMAVRLVQAGHCDPLKVFIKDEVHKEAKIAEGRLRLIMSNSVIDQIVERLLFSEQNSVEIANWLTCPSKPGIGLTSDAQTTALFDSVKEHLLRLWESDASGWDWHYQLWMYVLDLKRRALLNSADPNSSWMRIATAVIQCASYSVFVTSHGRFFAQTLPGLMKSGKYITSSANSAARNGCAYIVGADYTIAMGDDCNETSDKTEAELKEAYYALGQDMKMFRKCKNNSFEFCSHDFYADKAIPNNPNKGLVKLLYAKPCEQKLAQFSDEYRHVPDIKETLAFIRSLPGWGREKNAN